MMITTSSQPNKNFARNSHSSFQKLRARLSARWVSSEPVITSYSYSEITSDQPSRCRLEVPRLLPERGRSNDGGNGERRRRECHLEALLTTPRCLALGRCFQAIRNSHLGDVFNGCHAEIYAGVLGSAADDQSRRTRVGGCNRCPRGISRVGPRDIHAGVGAALKG